jgi:hypothetical protein
VVLKTLVSMPVSGYLVCAGFVIIGIGLRMAMQAVSDEDREEHQALPNDGFSWRDYYASADPVSNGPLRSGSGQGVWYDQTRLLPDSCNQVYNSASVLYDHNRYLRNQDQLLSRLLNDLAAAAYDDGPAIVCEDDLRRAGRRRHRLVLVLIACRVLSVGLAAWLWLADLGPHLEDPMNWVMGLFVPHAHMNEGLARFAAALLIATVVYLVFVSAWRIREEHVVRRFFRTTQRPWRAEQAAGLWVTGQAAGLRTAEQAARPAVRQEISAAIG